MCFQGECYGRKEFRLKCIKLVCIRTYVNKQPKATTQKLRKSVRFVNAFSLLSKRCSSNIRLALPFRPMCPSRVEATSQEQRMMQILQLSTLNPCSCKAEIIKNVFQSFFFLYKYANLMGTRECPRVLEEFCRWIRRDEEGCSVSMSYVLWNLNDTNRRDALKPRDRTLYGESLCVNVFFLSLFFVLMLKPFNFTIVHRFKVLPKTVEIPQNLLCHVYVMFHNKQNLLFVNINYKRIFTYSPTSSKEF